MIISLVLLIFIFGTVISIFNPKTSPLPVFLLIFILGYAAVCVSVLLLLRWIYPKMSKSRLTFSSCILAFCPIIILALQSVSSLSILNFMLALVLPIVIVWYAFKRDLINWIIISCKDVFFFAILTSDGSNNTSKQPRTI